MLCLVVAPAAAVVVGDERYMPLLQLRRCCEACCFAGTVWQVYICANGAARGWWLLQAGCRCVAQIFAVGVNFKLEDSE